jgi:hypothetical protein
MEGTVNYLVIAAFMLLVSVLPAQENKTASNPNAKTDPVVAQPRASSHGDVIERKGDEHKNRVEGDHSTLSLGSLPSAPGDRGREKPLAEN